MAFSIALRRATFAAARAAQGFCVRNCGSQVLLKGIVSRVESSELPSTIAFTRFYSSIQKRPATDAELIQIVESEIDCGKEERGEVEEVPKGFPFEIQDEKGTNAITLRRTFLGESIEVVVSMPTIEDTDENNEGEGDNEEKSGDDEEKTDQPTIPMTVNISKGKDGPNLEFSCTAYADEIVIDSLCIRGNKESDDLLEYEGPDFDDLDEKLQKAFYKYLETRGISTKTTNFLYQYLINKDDREYLLWLQNLKHFLEKH